MLSLDGRRDDGDQRARCSLTMLRAFYRNVHPKCIPAGRHNPLNVAKTVGKRDRPLPTAGVPILSLLLPAVEEGAVTRDRRGVGAQSEKVGSENGSLHFNVENEPHTFI